MARQTPETLIAARVAELAPPGTFTARMFVQAEIVASVLATFPDLFREREYDACALVGRMYGARFPQS